jgi:DNA-binding response OmpR family regulator
MKTQTKKKLLLADDVSNYRHSLRGLLELENYDVVEAASLEDAKTELQRSKIDLVIADLKLTDGDDTSDISGLEVAKAAKSLNIPCIIVTAYESVDVTRIALRSRGNEPLADDLIPKKDGPQAILDAISLILNNKRNVATNVTHSQLKIDLDQKLVWKKGKEIKLPRNQFALLAYLFEQHGAVCSQESLLKAVYHEDISEKDAMSDRRLERLVERLRKKIEDIPAKPRYLLGEQGRGYRLSTT